MRLIKEYGKRALTFLLALIMIFSDLSPVLSVFAANDIPFADMEPGVRYSATFKEYDVYLYDKDGNLAPYNGGPSTIPVSEFPANLIVVLENKGDKYVRIVNEDWPAAYDAYRYAGDIDIAILERLDPVVPTPDGSLIYGEVGLVVDGKAAAAMTIAKGEKTNVFTDLSSKIENPSSYSWQLLIDEENDRWANIPDYIYPYAPVSEALIANAGLEGAATLRCIVTADNKQYVSDELRISVDPNASAPAPFAPVDNKPTGNLSGSSASRSNTEAFHVQIDYIYWNNSPLPSADHGGTALPTFTATVSESLPLTATVPSLPIAGYKAYIRVDNWTAGCREYTAKEDPNDPNSQEKTHYYVEAPSITFNHQVEAFSIKVYYLPIDVSLTVNHYIQNLDNDEYTLDYTDDLMRPSASPVGEGLQRTLEGFSNLFYDPNVAVSASGNTIVNIYYDRNYYLVDFDLSGPHDSEGYGVMPLYVRYGTNVQVGTPQNPGYTFNGWELRNVYLKEETVDENGTIQEIKTEIVDTTIRNQYANAEVALTIQHNLYYKAKWVEAKTSYTIAYWLEDPEYVDPIDPNDVDINTKYKIWGTITKENVTTGSVVNGPIAKDVPDEWVKFTGTVKAEGNRTANINELDYLEFIKSDQGVVVKGDGSTVVNVYYDRKEYTLKFYYAKLDEGKTWQVCGRTNLFGNEASDKIDRTDEIKLLDNISGDFGSVVNQPQLKENVAEQKRYTLGYDTSGKDQYYYLSFKAKYGADISDQYPCDIFDPIQRASGNNTGNGWQDNRAIMSAWTGEYNVLFSYAGGNQTMKGKFQIFNYVMLWRSGSSNMLNDDRTVSYLCFWENAASVGGWNVPELYRYRIWVPVYAGQDTTDLRTFVKNGVTYYLLEAYDTCDNSSVGEQTQPILKGFTANGRTSHGNIYQYTHINDNDEGKEPPITSDELNKINAMKDLYKEAFVVDYFYTRNSAKLSFSDKYNYHKEINVPYEQSIKQYETEVPNYPSGVEQGAIVFAGDLDGDGVGDGKQWYLDKGYSLPFSFDRTMDVSNIQLYGKWEPTYWNITVYQEKPTAENPNPVKLWEHTKVPFGTLPNTLGKEPERTSPVTGYIFAGWYYEENGQEKRFDFNTMPIKHDYVIYAKWTSEVPVDYIVYYKAEIGGVLVDIAAPSKGQSLAGMTKSFVAKSGSDLYAGYRNGYFPTAREQTKMMELTQENDGLNIITFEYVTAKEVDYQIKHVFVHDDFVAKIGTDTITLVWQGKISGTGSAKLEEKFNDEVTHDNVIKELKEKGYSEAKAKDIWNIIIHMSPDAFTQSLTLVAGADAEQNEIVFNWSPHYDMTIYEVHHYYQSAENDGKYEMRGEPQRFNARYILNEGKAPDVEFPDYKIVKGYQYVRYKTNNADNQSLTLKLATATQEGLVIELYYDRETYNYTARFKDKDGFLISYSETVTRTGRYLDTINVGTFVKDVDIPGYTLVNGSENVVLEYDGQVIDCIYQKRTATYHYRVLSGYGGLSSLTDADIPFGGQPKGSQATPQDGWILEGWYYSENNDTSDLKPLSTVGATVSEDGTLIPRAVIAEDVGKQFFFWAKFVPTSLTIQSTIESTPANAWVTENQGFLYRITGAGVNFTVAVPEGESVTILGLPVGQYTITAQSSWSWRYDKEGENTRMVTISGNHTVVFEYNFPSADKDDKYYLTDEAFAITKLP